MSSTEPETTSNSSTSDDSKNGSLSSLMNGKNRNSGKKSPVKQQNATSQQQQQQQNNPNRCTWCAETKTPLKYVLPTQNGKKEFCSETCIAEFRKAYSKGACKECDNAIRANAPNRDFCSTYCLNKNNKKKGITASSPQAPSTSQNKLLNNNNNIENNNSKQQQQKSSTVEANNNNTIKEHAVTKISPMFQFEPFHVFDWNEYLKVS